MKPLDPPEENAADTVLAAFFCASEPAEANRLLTQIVNTAALPILRRTVARKLDSRVNTTDAEDLVSEAKELLIERLLSLRSAIPNGATETTSFEPPIRNLTAYTVSLAASVWAKHLSRAQPGRAILSNQLRHLLEDRRGLRGFTCWQDGDGERWCGLANWPSSLPARSPSSSTAVERHARLTTEPLLAAQTALAGQADPATCELAGLLRALLLWVGAPVPWHDLSGAVFQIRESHWKIETVECDEDAVGQTPDLLPTSHERLRWQESLQWLWRAAGELPPRQRAAYLLHTHAVFEWEAAGVASIGDVARQLGLPPEQLAGWWSRLPLDDLTIAQHLACTRQQIINLRRVARDTLGRAWQRWITEENRDKSKPNPTDQVISSKFPTRS